MILHKGHFQERLTLMIALDRTDVSRIMGSTPIIWKRYSSADLTEYGPDLMIHFIESPQEAARYANDVLTAGEKL